MYGILSLIGKKYGKDAMRRVLSIAQNYPDDRHVRAMRSSRVTDESRIGVAEALLRNAGKYVTLENKPTQYSGIMQTLKSKINQAGRTYWGEFGGERYIDDLAQNAIAQMAKRNFAQRGLTDYEKYMVTLARQRRQKAAEGAEIIPFPKRD